MKYIVLIVILYLSFNLSIEENKCTFGMKVEKSDDCLKLSTDDTLCCSLKSDFPKGKFCFPMKDSIYNGNNKMKIGDISYEVKCQKKDDKDKKPSFGEICGKSKAKSKKDCNKSSTKDSTCCYYNLFNIKGCVHYGKIYEGMTKISNIEVDC